MRSKRGADACDAVFIAAKNDLDLEAYIDLLVRFGMDLAAILVIAAFLYVRRHQRRDLLLVFVTFNLGVFGVLVVVTQHKLSAAVGFGLFALLSIVRLRSAPFANIELAYFFASLVIGVVNGVSRGDKALKLAVDIAIVAAVLVLDAGRLQRPIARRRVILDSVQTDLARLRADFTARFGVEIVDLRILEVDDVRETTSVAFRFVDRSRTMTGDDPEELVL